MSLKAVTRGFWTTRCPSVTITMGQQLCCSFLEVSEAKVPVVSCCFFFLLRAPKEEEEGSREREGGGREHSAWQYLHLSAVLFFVISGAVFVAERCRGNRRLEVRGGGGGVVEGRLVTQTPLWHSFCCASIFDPLSSLPCLRPLSTLHHHCYYHY